MESRMKERCSDCPMLFEMEDGFRFCDIFEVFTEGSERLVRYVAFITDEEFEEISYCDEISLDEFTFSDDPWGLLNDRSLPYSRYGATWSDGFMTEDEFNDCCRGIWEEFVMRTDANFCRNHKDLEEMPDGYYWF